MIMFPDKEGGRPHAQREISTKALLWFVSFTLGSLSISSENENREADNSRNKNASTADGAVSANFVTFAGKKEAGEEKGVFLPPPIFSSEWSHLGPICRSRLETEPRRYEKEENGNGWWFHLS